VAAELPGRVVELEIDRSDELLKGPTAGEPAAPKTGATLVVGQEGVAYRGIPVPTKHGVDGLGQLGAAGFVDADCITRIEFSGAVYPTLIPR